MARILSRTAAVVELFGWLAASPVAVAVNVDDSLQKLKELNKDTGNDALQGARRLLLLDDKAGAKQLVAAALPIAKEKKDALSYNAALVLALVSADMKDMATSEVF